MAQPQRPRRASDRSGARRRDQDGDVEFEKRRAVKMNPVVAITLFFVIPGIMLIIFFAVLLNRPDGTTETTNDDNEIVEDLNKEYEALKKKMKKGGKMYKEALALRTSDDSALFKKTIEAAIEFITDLVDDLDDITEDVRDPDTHQLPADYSYYQRDYDRLQKWVEDMVKSSPF